MPQIPRRQLLGGVASLVGVSFGARSQIVDVLPWRPDAGDPPESPHAADWTFFTPAEAATVEAVADRFIPPDETTAGGKDAGCAAFVDRHVAGPYGSRRGLYVSPPFLKGQNNQGPQDQDGPPAIYRKALAALDAYARRHKGGIFAKLSPNNKDEILKHLERGDVKLEGVDGQSFFETLLKAIREGFFADPIHGGNRDMCAWKVIGFPGARYDYRDCIGRHNQQFPLGPVSIMGAPDRKPPTKTRGLGMPRKLPSRDVLVIGLGWTGSIVAHELTDAGPARALAAATCGGSDESHPCGARRPAHRFDGRGADRPRYAVVRPEARRRAGRGRSHLFPQQLGPPAPAVAVDEVAAARRFITERAEH